MNQSALVLTMPTICEECNLFDSTWEWCHPMDRGVSKNMKPDWCPLKELPNKQIHSCIDNQFQRGAKNGFNHCLDIIANGKPTK